MSNQSAFLCLLKAYAAKDLARMSLMFAEDVALRDWTISVAGRTAVEAETAKNFKAAGTIEIEVLRMYEDGDTVAGELRITLDRETVLYVVDVVRFDVRGKVKAIRAYVGRAD